MSSVAVIPARGGSKGIPGRNLCPVGGIPLVVRTIEAARSCGRIDRIVVSTEDPAVAESSLHHNGSVDTAIQLTDVPADVGAQAVKLTKRTPAISTPEHMKNTPPDTPWGMMAYLGFGYGVELSRAQYSEIGDYATLRGRDCFASPWVEPSVDFLEYLNVVAYRVASASVTDIGMLHALAATGEPIILSTGISILDQIDRAVAVDRHITLDLTTRGSDHAASLEPQGFELLVRDIRVICQAMGDGVKRVFRGEFAPLVKLRRVSA